MQEIVCSALSEVYTDDAIGEITDILRTNHRLKADDDDDFSIRSQQELSSMLTSTTDMMTVLLAAVAGISLLVGGIGIMNIMYVSVTERTREIGLRMSIGAKSRDILAQFLIESILISVTGGLIGVVFGVGAAVVVNVAAAFPIYIQPWASSSRSPSAPLRGSSSGGIRPGRPPCSIPSKPSAMSKFFSYICQYDCFAIEIQSLARALHGLGRDLRQPLFVTGPDRPLLSGGEYLRFLRIPLSFMVVSHGITSG